MKTILLLLFFVSIGCLAAPKPIAKKILLHRSEECAELSNLEVVVEELTMLTLGKRASSGCISPATPISPTNSSPSYTRSPTPITPCTKRAHSTQPDDVKQG